MKRKCIAMLALAAVLMTQPMCTFANNSVTSGSGGTSSSGSGGGSSGGGSSGGHAVMVVSSNGVKIAASSNNIGPSGSMIGVAVDTVTTTGQSITTNEKGEAVIGDTVIGFADSTSATAGLPDAVVSAINDINAGKALSETVMDVDLTGYNALTGTHAIITKDANTGDVKKGPVEVSLYVPNLMENLNEVQVLFYSNETGKWELLPIIKKDIEAKTVNVIISGSGTLSVVYKN